MIYFQDWWSYGENCIVETYKGILAGDKKFNNDICIYDSKELNIFTDSIAKEIIIDTGKKGQNSKPNKDDVFLNKKINIDFNKNILFVFIEANIQEIVYSKIFECYLITYNEEPAEENTYYAVLAKKIYPQGSNYYIINDYKKIGENDSGDNKNNEDNVHTKKFEPKFDTMNDKPKPKKGSFAKSYNDDY